MTKGREGSGVTPVSSRAAEGEDRVGREGSGNETSTRFLASLGMTVVTLGVTGVAFGAPLNDRSGTWNDSGGHSERQWWRLE
jgi:hypothetical protein